MPKLKDQTKTILLLLAGLLGGFFSGMLGAGGGVIIAYAFSKLSRGEREIPQKTVFANSLATTLPLSVFSSVPYLRDGRIDLAHLWPLIPASLLGGLIGGTLLGKVADRGLRATFAIVVVLSGILMLLR